MDLLINYILRMLPAVIIIIIGSFLLRPNKSLRIIIYILSFILLRDALTPASLWSLGITNGVPWIRLYLNHIFLIGMGFFSLIFVILLMLFDKENSKEITLINRTKAIPGLLFSIVALIILVAPFIIVYGYSNVETRGGIVPEEYIISILFFSLFGNFLEEVLFRGYIYNFFRKKDNDIKAGIISGFVFCFFHIYLATTVTSIGTPLLLFTLWEGIICGIVGSKYGVIPSTIVHGGAIFLLTSGLI